MKLMHLSVWKIYWEVFGRSMGAFGKNTDRYIENQADKKLKQLFI